MKTPKLSCQFLGKSREDLINFPCNIKRKAGYFLDMLQEGEKPAGKDTIKAMQAIGKGVFEIRIPEADGTFRIIYTAKFHEKIYILHCFQKKTERTTQKDIKIAKDNYNKIR